MSDSASSISLSPTLSKKEIVTWIGTYYYNCMPHNISNMNLNVIWRCEPFKPRYVDFLLEFQLVRVSELEFRITCIRMPSPSSPTGSYMLQFHCFINVFGDKPRVFEMPSREFIIFGKFFLHNSYRQHFTQNDLNKHFGLKILVKMIEWDCSETQFFHEEEYHKLKEEHAKDESVMSDLCYLLDIPISIVQFPRIQDILTGRQNDEFAALKMKYIRNTALMSKEIVKYVKSVKARRPLRTGDAAAFLNFILHGEEAEISPEDLLETYYQAHHLGLRFLVLLSRSYLCVRKYNTEYFLGILQAANNLNDEVLFYECADVLKFNESNLSNYEKWFDMVRDSSVECDFIMMRLLRLKNTKPRQMPIEGEDVQSFFDIN